MRICKTLISSVLLFMLPLCAAAGGSRTSLVDRTSCKTPAAGLELLRLKNGFTAKIVLYAYSSGDEIYTRNDDGSIRADIAPGEMKALVTIRKDGRMVKAFFVAGTGSGCSGGLRSIIEKIPSAGNGYFE